MIYSKHINFFFTLLRILENISFLYKSIFKLIISATWKYLFLYVNLDVWLIMYYDYVYDYFKDLVEDRQFENLKSDCTLLCNKYIIIIIIWVNVIIVSWMFFVFPKLIEINDWLGINCLRHWEPFRTNRAPISGDIKDECTAKKMGMRSDIILV